MSPRFLSPEGGLQKLDLLLNRGLNLRVVSADVPVKQFTFDRTQPSPYRYTQPASPLVVEFGEAVESGKTITVRLRYDGTIEPDPYHTNVLTADWVELALYVAWYPVDPGSGSTTFPVKVKGDEPYRVTGTGTLSQTADGWQLIQTAPTFDIVVIAARNLGVRRIGDDTAGVEVWYLTEEQVDQIAVQRHSAGF